MPEDTQDTAVETEQPEREAPAFSFFREDVDPEQEPAVTHEPNAADVETPGGEGGDGTHDSDASGPQADQASSPGDAPKTLKIAGREYTIGTDLSEVAAMELQRQWDEARRWQGEKDRLDAELKRLRERMDTLQDRNGPASQTPTEPQNRVISRAAERLADELGLEGEDRSLLQDAIGDQVAALTSELREAVTQMRAEMAGMRPKVEQSTANLRAHEDVTMLHGEIEQSGLDPSAVVQVALSGGRMQEASMAEAVAHYYMAAEKMLRDSGKTDAELDNEITRELLREKAMRFALRDYTRSQQSPANGNGKAAPQKQERQAPPQGPGDYRTIPTGAGGGTARSGSPRYIQTGPEGDPFKAMLAQDRRR